MKARDVMTRKVRSVAVTTPVRKIAQTMMSRGISAVPVVDRRRLVIGIISEGDLLRRAEAGTQRRRSWWTDLLGDPSQRAREYVKARGARARDVMSYPVISITTNTDVADIVDLMERWQVKRLPVVDHGKLVGIVSRRDLLRAVGRAKPPVRRGKVSDAMLRERLRRQLDATPWVGSSLVNFVVEGGAIELFGLAATRDERDAVRVMAENIPGVRSVRDKIVVRPQGAYGL
jgi:CBS domain-containing protein